MALALTNLPEIRLERGERAFEPAAERGNARVRGGNHRCTRIRVLEPSRRPQRQSLDVAHLFGAARRVERRIDFCEIPNIRPMQNRRAELDRLDRILTAMARQRSTNEYDRGEPIDETELAQRVGDVDLGVAARQFPARAQGRGKAGGLG